MPNMANGSAVGAAATTTTTTTTTAMGTSSSNSKSVPSASPSGHKSSSAGNLLARLNFPPYTVRVLTERHILVAGGGGMAKTGVKNSIEIYELIHSGPPGASGSRPRIPKNGTIGECRAQLVAHFDAGSCAPMNSCVFIPKGCPSGSLYLATGGMGGECQLYEISLTTTNHDPDEQSLFKSSLSHTDSDKFDHSHHYALSRTSSLANGDVADGLRRRRTSSACSDHGDDPTTTAALNGSASGPSGPSTSGSSHHLASTPRHHHQRHERKPSKPPLLNGSNGSVLNGSLPNGVNGLAANGSTTTTIGSSDTPNGYPIPSVIFNIKPVKSFQADFHPDKEERFLKVVRYSRATGLLVTGGVDGKIRVWSYPVGGGRLLHTIDAHKDEVDDLDVDPLTGDQVVSVSRDGYGYVWSAKTGKRTHELRKLIWQQNGTKYVTRACRFGIVPRDPSQAAAAAAAAESGHSAARSAPSSSSPSGPQRRLYTIMNPVVRCKPPKPAYIVRWNPDTWEPESYETCPGEVLSSLSLSDDGRFLAVGTLSGAVAIHITWSLRRLYSNPTAHNIFITGVEFLATCPATQTLTGGQDTSLISVSVDNHIVAHHIPKQVQINFFSSMAAFILFMFIMYLLMDFAGL